MPEVVLPSAARPGTAPGAEPADPFYRPKRPVRFVTAASLFDGHDASINIIRRLLQAGGAEVVHLGHNRSVEEIVTAAIQEDAQAICISSYQGGHMEFLRYMRDLLVERGSGHVMIFAGGGGTIVPREIRELHAFGISRVFSPADGRSLGLVGMANVMLEAADYDQLDVGRPDLEQLRCRDGVLSQASIARFITLAENDVLPDGDRRLLDAVRAATAEDPCPVVGLTGPGGAGKSSFVDEVVLRFRRDFPSLRLGIVSVDPTKRRTGGALLGDRIRMNAVNDPHVFMRSLATRQSGRELSAHIDDVIAILRVAGCDLILLETSGIGQGGSGVVDVANPTVYVMTPEYGAASQLEKIDMLDLADLVVLNKFDRRGAADALRDVRKQFRRPRLIGPEVPDDELPVFGTISSNFNDAGVTAAYLGILAAVGAATGRTFESGIAPPGITASPDPSPVIPPTRVNYMAEVATACRHYARWAESQIQLAHAWDGLEQALGLFEGREEAVRQALKAELERVKDAMDPKPRAMLEDWPALERSYRGEELVYHVRDREVRAPLSRPTLAGLRVPRVALPKGADRATAMRFLLLENVPGGFPFTAGVFPLKRDDEDPKRMFAGEGGPRRTNRRFHYLCEGETSNRLSTAFDSVTLYGQDPDLRPDIYGKVGESGVSICTLDDMKALYAGFDLCDPNTSVSMTINGPAPMILAMFMNTAVDQQVDRFREREGRDPTAEEAAEIRARTLRVTRGTVQADILKEDQAQNTCIFSMGFALRMMGDIQQYFIEKEVRNYYSVSISGYHIAEAGANPITQLAFTLANAFTYVEAWRARGMQVDQFAQNLSFFFSNGLDAEYTVLGRVARRIWAVAMRDVYDAQERSQKLKYHIQTSGRSLHAMEVEFNDIRTTLQALLAIQDNCNSLHTNAYDEAVTTPTEESVRRAMAIQLILTREFGLMKNENALQGSYIAQELTDLVEEAVLTEFERISDRGGVLGAMETQYQRGKIQEESMLYERMKHSGELPVIGVNAFVNAHDDSEALLDEMPLTRADDDEKRSRIEDLRAFEKRHAAETPAALERLQQVVLDGGNVFEELMSTVRVASLGQITRALFDVGGEYRRNL